MKILSSFLTLKFFQTCMSFFVLFNIKEDFEVCCKQIVAGRKVIMWESKGPANVWLPTLLVPKS